LASCFSLAIIRQRRERTKPAVAGLRLSGISRTLADIRSGTVSTYEYSPLDRFPEIPGRPVVEFFIALT
jgi:hypothetical protein